MSERVNEPGRDTLPQSDEGSSQSQYARWVRLANDPSQPDEVRERCRAAMQAHLHSELRQAFAQAYRPGRS